MTAPLQFEVHELISEVELMRGLAIDFLEEGSVSVLMNVVAQLEVLRYSEGVTTVAVGPDWPIKTVACGGGYERDDGGAYKDLYGEIVFQWQLRPLGDASKKPQARRRVEVAGIASTIARLKVNEGGTMVDVASWRMEFGDSQSPGAFFHAQIPDAPEGAGQEDGVASPDRRWPHWLPVPRLPIPALTPMLALEFTLAEIFQDRWPRHLASGGYEVDQWRVLQKRRYARYFEWQRDNAETSGEGSPVVATKRAKPASDMFLSRQAGR